MLVVLPLLPAPVGVGNLNVLVLLILLLLPGPVGTAGFHLCLFIGGGGAEGKSEWSNGGGCKKISSFFLHNFLYIVMCT